MPDPNADGKRPTILLVEDDQSLVSLLSLGLAYEGFDVLSAGNGQEGLKLAVEQSPDLIILDWMLPGLDGVSLCRRLRGRGNTSIIMLTARDAVSDRVAGLEAGADDYLVKPFEYRELLARVRVQMRHRIGERPDAQLSFANVTLDPSLHEVSRAGNRISLTATEFRLLQYFLRHPRQVLAKGQILDQVWGYDFAGDDNILEQYVRSLRRKLGEPQLIQTVRLVGYVLREAEV